MQGPARGAERDLDLQFHWRAAKVCQELHELERDADFRPFQNLVVERGEGHRVLLLLPSLDGVVSVASYTVELADSLDAELTAAITIEASAASKSDGVEYAVAVGEEGTALDASAFSFKRLTPEDALVGWQAVRVDLAPYRGRSVRITLAARETGDRSGDWLLWGDPRVVAKRPASLRIDMSTPHDDDARSLTDIPWREANVFKAYSGFNEDAQQTKGNTLWLQRTFPWIDRLRLFSSLGANWGPTLARDYASQMDQNPTRDSREERQWAEYYEFFRDGPEWARVSIDKRFAWKRFDTLLARIAATGARLHVNLSGAPEAFTGGAGHYHTYHYNEMPIVDAAGWKTYIDRVFRHLSRQPWYQHARFSFFTEPNCRWVNSDGSVKHFGFQGDAAQYARQYLWTWQAMKPYVRPGQVHLGPFVAEPDPAVPVTDNLREYVRLLRDEFSRSGEPLPRWSAFAFNIYETPQLAIDHFTSHKIDFVRRLLADELPQLELPIRFDEVGIHPLIATAFADAGSPGFDGSRWAAAWHAEMLALSIDQRIETSSPWLFAEMLRPYVSYAFVSLASSRFLRASSGDGRFAIVRRDAPAATSVHVRLGSRSADRVGYVWSSSADDTTTRIALWQFPRFPASDQWLIDAPARIPVDLHLGGCARTRCAVTLSGYEDQAFETHPELGPQTSSRVPIAALSDLPHLRRIATSTTGRLRLVLRPGEVYLLEIEAAEPSRAAGGFHADPSLHAP